MTRRSTSARGGRSPAAPRVGLFGLLGSGNIGNDASMESILGYLRSLEAYDRLFPGFGHDTHGVENHNGVYRVQCLKAKGRK